MLAFAPRFSKFVHACACLHADQVSGLPYWFLPNADGSLSPASWEEMLDTAPAAEVRCFHFQQQPCEPFPAAACRPAFKIKTLLQAACHPNDG